MKIVSGISSSVYTANQVQIVNNQAAQSAPATP